MTFEEIKALDEQYVMRSYGRFQVAIDHGKGATVWAVDGKEYIDFSAGIGVCSLGYGDPGWVEAVSTQAAKLGHISNLFYTEPYAKVAHKLCVRTGMSNVMFGNSGAEANEAMIKLARKYSFDRYGKGRGTVITLRNSFHGRTITTLAATGQDKFHNYFFPFTEGFRYADANDLDSVEAVAGHDVCAVMMELVQGEGGVLPLDLEFVQKVAELCALSMRFRAAWAVPALCLPSSSITSSLMWCPSPRASLADCPSAASWPMRSAERCSLPALTAPPSGATLWPPPPPAMYWTGWTTPFWPK